MMINTILTVAGWIMGPLMGLVIGLLVSYIKQTKAIKKGIQALLRDRLIDGYNKADERGYADFDDRLNWINMYEQYHTLNTNGVMDNTKELYLALPVHRRDRRRE